MRTYPIILLFLVAIFFCLPNATHAKIYKKGDTLFDIYCVNEHFDYIAPSSYHHSLYKRRDFVEIKAFAEGYRHAIFRFPISPDKKFYRFDLKMLDPVVDVRIVDLWGNTYSDSYFNAAQGLGYGGDRYGIICYVPQESFPDLTIVDVHLAREWGPRFKDVKYSLTQEGEFVRLVVKLRRIDLWDDWNRVYVVLNRDDKQKRLDDLYPHQTLNHRGSYSTPDIFQPVTGSLPPEIEQLFFYQEQIDLARRATSVSSLADYRHLRSRLTSRFQHLESEVEVLANELLHKRLPENRAKPICTRFKRLKSDLKNLKRLTGYPLFSRSHSR